MKKIEFIPPSRIEFEAYEMEDGNWRLVYREYFKELEDDVFKNSVSIIQFIKDRFEHKLKSINVNEKEKMIQIEAVGSREEIFNGLSNEFIQWSSLGKYTISELLALALLDKTIKAVLKGGG